MVEIGGFCGYSAVRFASKLRAVSGASAHYYSFEFSSVFAGIATEVRYTLLTVAHLSKR
jgi:catechol O-methyltransferase